MSQSSISFFADFSFDMSSKELRQNNTVVPLQPKQADLLAMLLATPDTLITRQQIQEQLWPNQVLEFDQSINFCIKCIRQVLNDNSKQPTFIQTIPRRGYRFIASLSQAPALQEKPHSKEGMLNKTCAPLFSIRYKLMTVFLVITAIIGFYSWRYLNSTSTQLPNHTNDLIVSSEVKRGIFLFEKADYHSRLRSRELFEKALVKQADDPIAHAYLSMAYSLTASSKSDTDKAREHMQIATHYNKALAESFMAEGLIKLYGDWDVPLAYKAIKQATILRPEWSLAWHELASLAAISGDYQTAINSIDKLLAINPEIAQERYHAGWFYMVSGDWEKALFQCEQAIELNPELHSSLICAAFSASKLNLHQLANNYYSKVVNDLAKEPESTELKTEINKGNYTQFYQWMLKIQRGYNAGHFSLALSYASISENNKALQELQLAADNHEAMLPTAWAFPEFSHLRETHEFINIMKVVKRH